MALFHLVKRKATAPQSKAAMNRRSPWSAGIHSRFALVGQMACRARVTTVGECTPRRERHYGRQTQGDCAAIESGDESPQSKERLAPPNGSWQWAVGRVGRVFTRPTEVAVAVGLVKTRTTLPPGDGKAGRSLELVGVFSRHQNSGQRWRVRAQRTWRIQIPGSDENPGVEIGQLTDSRRVWPEIVAVRSTFPSPPRGRGVRGEGRCC